MPHRGARARELDRPRARCYPDGAAPRPREPLDLDPQPPRAVRVVVLEVDGELGEPAFPPIEGDPMRLGAPAEITLPVGALAAVEQAGRRLCARLGRALDVLRLDLALRLRRLGVLTRPAAQRPELRRCRACDRPQPLAEQADEGGDGPRNAVGRSRVLAHAEVLHRRLRCESLQHLADCPHGLLAHGGAASSCGRRAHKSRAPHPATLRQSPPQLCSGLITDHNNAPSQRRIREVGPPARRCSARLRAHSLRHHHRRDVSTRGLCEPRAKVGHLLRTFQERDDGTARGGPVPLGPDGHQARRVAQDSQALDHGRGLARWLRARRLALRLGGGAQASDRRAEAVLAHVPVAPPAAERHGVGLFVALANLARVAPCARVRELGQGMAGRTRPGVDQPRRRPPCDPPLRADGCRAAKGEARPGVSRVRADSPRACGGPIGVVYAALHLPRRIVPRANLVLLAHVPHAVEAVHGDCGPTGGTHAAEADLAIRSRRGLHELAVERRVAGTKDHKRAARVSQPVQVGACGGRRDAARCARRSHSKRGGEARAEQYVTTTSSELRHVKHGLPQPVQQACAVLQPRPCVRVAQRTREGRWRADGDTLDPVAVVCGRAPGLLRKGNQAVRSLEQDALLHRQKDPSRRPSRRGEDDAKASNGVERRDATLHPRLGAAEARRRHKPHA
mmetsp:Transcript_37542/g.121606  ORF Transcript_37542/g.121606 Transcript_37542/m.121606 type:complete len:678 (-) Transcript_37542:2041-4074(-)